MWFINKDGDDLEWRGRGRPPVYLEDIDDVAEYLYEGGFLTCDNYTGWEGNCAGVAKALIDAKLVGGTDRYGHYLGPVASNSMFAGPSAGFVQHGWIEQQGGIVDPTRWTLASPDEPEIAWFAKDETRFINQYDVGGRKFRKTRHADVPPFIKGDREKVLKFPAEVDAFVRGLLPGPGNRYSIKQVFWLANHDPDEMEPHAAAIYDELKLRDLGGLIPIDNVKLVREGRILGRRALIRRVR
ncbi:MAG TPA: hypothetical protein EYF98_10810 [Planctomycetes bacterium]|nr:hypothetical protein [Planctomycetota bacterium]